MKNYRTEDSMKLADKQPNAQHRQQGLTLVEIMVAVALSVILLTGVIQIFVGSKATYRLQDNIARLQENGRFALDFLTRDVRMAGYRGCTNFVKSTNTLKN
jgi:type IV pilus assembly protein PilW